MEDLKTNRAVWKDAEKTALDELRMEFEDIRLRLRRTPEQFIVLSDLAVRSWRDPVVAKIFKKLDDGWHAHLVALLERGIQQGIFRNNLNVPLCARAMMVALRGIGYHSRLPRGKVDELVSELAAQTECWITAGDEAARVNQWRGWKGGVRVFTPPPRAVSRFNFLRHPLLTVSLKIGRAHV